jgi:hypothetical protein
LGKIIVWYPAIPNSERIYVVSDDQIPSVELDLNDKSRFSGSKNFEFGIAVWYRNAQSDRTFYEADDCDSLESTSFSPSAARGAAGSSIAKLDRAPRLQSNCSIQQRLKICKPQIRTFSMLPRSNLPC